MLIRIVERSLARRGRRKLLGAVAVALGITVMTVVAGMALDVGDKVNRELRSFGANLSVMPAADGLAVSVGGVDYRPAGAGAFLPEADLVNLKKIFWRNNILAFAPFLYAPSRVAGRQVVLIGTWFEKTLTIDKGEVFQTGINNLHPAWKLQGKWPDDGGTDECLVGRRLAQALGVKAGDTVEGETPNFRFHVVGVIETGGREDDQILAPLAAVQALAGEEGKVRRIEVSALTKPEDDFARADPRRMTPAQFERWSCSPYASSIAYQIEQAIPGSVAKSVLPVTETEGRILNRVGVLMALLAGAALAAATLAVASMMLASVLERRAEIGLFKSLGATNAAVAAVFLLEASVIGLSGGIAGYFTGSLLARRLARAVFGTPVAIHWELLPASLAVALLVTWAGSGWPLAKGLRVAAAVALRD